MSCVNADQCARFGPCLCKQWPEAAPFVKRIADNWFKIAGRPAPTHFTITEEPTMKKATEAIDEVLVFMKSGVTGVGWDTALGGAGPTSKLHIQTREGNVRSTDLTAGALFTVNERAKRTEKAEALAEDRFKALSALTAELEQLRATEEHRQIVANANAGRPLPKVVTDYAEVEKRVMAIDGARLTELEQALAVATGETEAAERKATALEKSLQMAIAAAARSEKQIGAIKNGINALMGGDV